DTQPVRDRPQRDAPLQQPGSLDARGQGGSRLHHRGQRGQNLALVRERGGRIPRDLHSTGARFARACGVTALRTDNPRHIVTCQVAERRQALTRLSKARTSYRGPTDLIFQQVSEDLSPWHGLCSISPRKAPFAPRFYPNISKESGK